MAVIFVAFLSRVESCAGVKCVRDLSICLLSHLFARLAGDQEGKIGSFGVADLRVRKVKRKELG